MSEPMKPGRELDKLVAEIVGYPGRIAPRYSTDIAAAWQAWEWLNKDDNAPYIMLLREYKSKPAVMGVVGNIFEDEFWSCNIKLWIEGESYPHAIALAVVAARNANAE